MKTIQLTKGYEALVDDEDFEHLNQWTWCMHNKYARRTTSENKKTKNILMHRAILKLKDKKVLVDHINRNGLDNQKHNLRICTSSQNGANRKTYGKSKYLGVCSNRDKWVSFITKNKKQYYLGIFETEDDAAIAYNNKAIELHGEFANLNIIS